MDKEKYMALMEAQWEKMESMEKINNFYELEKEADKVFSELNRGLLEMITKGKGEDRREKKTANKMGRSKSK